MGVGQTKGGEARQKVKGLDKKTRGKAKSRGFRKKIEGDRQKVKVLDKK